MTFEQTMLFTAWGDLVQSMWSNDAATIPAIGRDDEFAYIADDGAFASLNKLEGESTTYRTAVAARSILTYDTYNPAHSLERLRCPTLLVASRNDRFVPFAAVAAAAERDGVELVEVGGDHFDIYVEPRLSEATRHQTDFLLRVLACP